MGDEPLYEEALAATGLDPVALSAEVQAGAAGCMDALQRIMAGEQPQPPPRRQRSRRGQAVTA